MQEKKVLIVEDEMIIATDISMFLQMTGYQVLGICTSGEEALIDLESKQPDLILMDIMLAGKLDGVDTAHIIQEKYNIPLIFLTSNSDDASFERAIKTKPFAFIAKPFQEAILSRNIKIAFQHIIKQKEENGEKEDLITSLNEHLFIRQQDQMVKVFIKDILYLEADRSYCKIYTEQKNYMASTPLGTIEKELAPEKFIRTHRSYIVNIDKVNSIADNKEHLFINTASIPISRRNKDEVFNQITKA